jgi:NitT/TauT family transport system permease protein
METGAAWAIRIGVFVLVTGLWQLLANLGIVSLFLVSAPNAIWQALVKYVEGPDIWVDVLATFEASLVGVVIGSSLGIITGVLFAKVPVVERAFRPYVTVLNALPRVALAPLFLVWFGLGLASKVFAATSIVYFVLLINTLVGLLSVDRDISFLAESMAMSRWQRFRLIDMPSALPAMVAGLRLGVVYSVLGVVVTEMVASYHGLGQSLIVATTNLRMDQAFAVIIMITAVATFLDLMVSILERRLRSSREA